MIRTQSAGGVVLNANGEIAVVNQHRDSWSLPKGHIDPGEDALAAAIREIREETGLKKITLVRALPAYERTRIGKNGEEPNEMKTITMFLFTTDETTLAPEDPDNPEARWLAVDDVAALLTHPKDKEFFRAIVHTLPNSR